MQALDPFFPIGAFTLSNGMETYVQKEIVHDKDSLYRFMIAYLSILPYSDLGFVAKAITEDNFCELDMICTASKSPYELRSGCEKMCARFIKAEKKIGDYPFLNQYNVKISSNECSGCYPIAIGLFIKDIGIDVIQGLNMYCYSILSTIVNHAVKLVPLRQLDGQSALKQVLSFVPSACEKAMNVELNELGVSGGGFDLRSMEHEKLYSRLYIS